MVVFQFSYCREKERRELYLKTVLIKKLFSDIQKIYPILQMSFFFFIYTEIEYIKYILGPAASY